MNAAAASQLNRAIAHGAEKGTFVLPKGDSQHMTPEMFCLNLPVCQDPRAKLNWLERGTVMLPKRSVLKISVLYPTFVDPLLHFVICVVIQLLEYQTSFQKARCGQGQSHDHKKGYYHEEAIEG